MAVTATVNSRFIIVTQSPRKCDQQKMNEPRERMEKIKMHKHNSSQTVYDEIDANL